MDRRISADVVDSRIALCWQSVRLGAVHLSCSLRLSPEVVRGRDGRHFTVQRCVASASTAADAAAENNRCHGDAHAQSLVKLELTFMC